MCVKACANGKCLRTKVCGWLGFCLSQQRQELAEKMYKKHGKEKEFWEKGKV